jgi:hypothetical protein
MPGFASGNGKEPHPAVWKCRSEVGKTPLKGDLIRVNTRLLMHSLWVAVLAAAISAVPALAAPPANTTAPSITGTPRVGETLTAQNGTWSNSPTAFQYQWQRCNAAGAACANIGTATDRTYLLQQADANRTIRVVVTALNGDGAGSARSNQTDLIAPSTAPRNTAAPTIEGDAIVGEQLTANDGTWTNSPTSFAYQWQRCDIDALTCAPVPGATAKTYNVGAADLGFRLRVVVTARNAGGAGSARSAPTEIVAPAVRFTNERPRLTLISARFLGARMYARFRVCDDDPRNLTVLATDAKPRQGTQLRRYTTRVAPKPCGVYTRSWVPARKFRTKGRYTVTLQARDFADNLSNKVSRSFNLR